MHITTLRLRSYGPFDDSDELHLRPGINLIVGQNNAGKTAILRSLRNENPDWPHRSLERFRQIDLRPSTQEVTLVANGAEVRRAMLRRGGEYWWPVPSTFRDMDHEAFRRDNLTEERQYRFRFTRHSNGLGAIGPGPVHGGFDEQLQRLVQLTAQPPDIRPLNVTNGGQPDNSIDVALQLWAHDIFRFDAERMSIGKCQQQATDELTSNAANLPAVLQRMQGNRPAMFARLVARVREVLPSVHSVTTVPVGGSETEIFVWPTPNMDYAEHGFPLADSGTGVAQVLAILTAVMTRTPSIIVIDEINSFLHPAAVKALLRILRTEFAEHQYVVSTHSAEVIAASSPATLTVVKRDGFDSNVRSVSPTDTDELRELGDLLGISIGDIFAADRVLWVEGRTEELCIPFLLHKMEIPVPAGLVVSPVVATGDFGGGRRDADLVFAVYDRLSRVTLPLVRSVTFTFDSEGLSEANLEDLTRRARGRLLFLPRRHLECYVVDALAIRQLVELRGCEGVSAEQVQSVLERRAQEGRYGARELWTGDLGSSEWLASVDAANLIKDTVAEVTENRVEFRKTNDTQELLRIILDRDPEALPSLRSYLEDLMTLVGRDE